MININLTPTQIQILANLENEFINLNNAEQKPFKLLSKEAFDIEAFDIDKAIKEIEINNRFVNDNLKKLISDDLIKLNECLNKMGIVATEYSNPRLIRVDIKGEENRNFPDITFEYKILGEVVYFSDGRHYTKNKGVSGISFYINSNQNKLFSNLDELCENESFINKIKWKYNSTKK
jgi:hypothetical protein